MLGHAAMARARSGCQEHFFLFRLSSTFCIYNDSICRHVKRVMIQKKIGKSSISFDLYLSLSLSPLFIHENESFPSICNPEIPSSTHYVCGKTLYRTERLCERTKTNKSMACSNLLCRTTMLSIKVHISHFFLRGANKTKPMICRHIPADIHYS